jgi:hypothetical protein
MKYINKFEIGEFIKLSKVKYFGDTTIHGNDVRTIELIK